MKVLNKNQIKELIEESKLVSECIHLPTQLTPNGIDLTVSKISKINEKGSLDFGNDERYIPEAEEVKPEKKNPDDDHGWWSLSKGCYKIKTNEKFKIPKNVIGICQPRSSLLRMGASVSTGVWDAGFEGKAEFLLTVENEEGIELKENCRITQLVFFLIDETDEGYEGIHKNLD